MYKNSVKVLGNFLYRSLVVQPSQLTEERNLRFGWFFGGWGEWTVVVDIRRGKSIRIQIGGSV